jgi:hypothetical protein
MKVKSRTALEARAASIFNELHGKYPLSGIMYVIGKVMQIQSLAMIGRDTQMFFPGELDQCASQIYEIHEGYKPCEITYILGTMTKLQSLAMLQDAEAGA